MYKLMSAKTAAGNICDGDIVMMGGFGKWGYAMEIIRSLYEDSQAKDLTLIMNSSNKSVHIYIEKLLETRCRSVICSFMRNSTASQKLYREGKAVLMPQGTLAECIRLAGVGIPAFYNPVGIGTEVAENKETRFFNGKEYLLNETLKGQVALFRATQVDMLGNCYLRGATKNFSPLMALACDKVYVEAQELAKEPLQPDLITVPGILVDGIVEVGKGNE